MALISLHNKTPQVLSVAAYDAKGNILKLKLQPHSKSVTIDETALTPYTQRLVDQGRIKIRKEKAHEATVTPAHAAK